jgi:hypothetical protein
MVNKQLKPLGFELCHATLENADEHWYAMVNRVPDAAALVGSSFTPQQLEYFNKVVSPLLHASIITCLHTHLELLHLLG